MCICTVETHTSDPGHVSPWNYLLFRVSYFRATQTISDLIQCLLEVSPWIRSQIRTLRILPLAWIFTPSNFLFKSSLTSLLSQFSQFIVIALKMGFERKIFVYFHDSNQSKQNPEQLRNKAKMPHMFATIFRVEKKPKTLTEFLTFKWLGSVRVPTVRGQADRNGE